MGTVPLEELREKTLVRLPHPPFDVVVAIQEGTVYALEDACNHAGASLAEGWLDERCIVCPMHAYVFELASGKLVRPRGLCGDQRTYVARIEGDVVAVYDLFKLVVT